MSANCCDEADKQKLKEVLENRSILLVGPGKILVYSQKN